MEAGLPSSPVHSFYFVFAVDTPLTVSAVDTPLTVSVAELSGVRIRNIQIQIRQRESWESLKSVLGNLDVLCPKYVGYLLVI